MNESRDESQSSPPSQNFDLSAARIDPPHPMGDAGATEVPVTSRRRKRKAVSEAMPVGTTSQERPEPVIDAPQYLVESSEPIADIIVRHADDLSLHLAARLKEVEQRELALAEFEGKLREAEAAAKAWVAERDIELTARERDVQFREDEVATRSAAIAAVELAGEEELSMRRRVLDEHQRELQQKTEELDQRQDRLQAERAALDQATEKLRADRRREEELQRSRRQQWQTQIESDRAQAERMVAQLLRHRHALDQRERALDQRERDETDKRVTVAATPAVASLEALRVQAEVTRERRIAAEHRWIAGQLWQRLVNSELVSNDQLSDSLTRLRSEIQRLYRHESETLEQLRRAIASAAGHMQPDVKRTERPMKTSERSVFNAHAARLSTFAAAR